MESKMPEVNIAEPVVKEVVAPVVEIVKEATPEPDLITKVSQFKRATPQVPENKENGSNTFSEFDDIKDPVAREIAIKRDKERTADYTRKTQELSQQRKEVDAKLQEMSNWTPERIQNYLLNNPSFLQAAQQLDLQRNPPNSGLTDEQFSALTPQEKAEIASLKSELSQLKQTNTQNFIRAEITQKDAQLQTRYADYNPTSVDEAIKNLSTMTLPDVREYAYKAMLHDDHVKAAYEMGRQEARGLNQQKMNVISPSGTEASNNDSVPTKQKGENDQAFFVRLGQFRLAQSRQK